MPTLFDVKIGESQSAIEEESGEDERVQVRGSGGRFFVQENTVAEDGRQLNKQTIGRGSRDVDRQIDRARSRVSERIDGIDPVTFERQIPTGRFAPDGTQPDASVPSDRGPEGRFVSGQRKPVDSFGREEIGGQFTPFDIGTSTAGSGSTDEQFGGGSDSGRFDDSSPEDAITTNPGTAGRAVEEFNRGDMGLRELGSELEQSGHDSGGFLNSPPELTEGDDPFLVGNPGEFNSPYKSKDKDTSD